MTPVRFGVDRLIADPALLGTVARVGLVTNDAARLAADATRHSRGALIAAGVPAVRLFGPEHGLTAAADDGAAVADGVDPLTALPVVSLYGERMRPDAASLQELDAVLFDIPDVGARFYTYTWTLFHMMAACAEHGVRLVVLDRPNPLGARIEGAEGPVLEDGCRSFVGEDAIPIRHQLTHGELARLWQRERFGACALDVIACSGWTRAMRWPETTLPWVPTSPAMPSFESAALYTGTCLFEAANLSVARGTDAPFQMIGAPWLDVAAVLADLARRVPKGVEFEEVTFVPSLKPYAGEPCRGVRIHVTSPGALRPVALGMLLMAAIASTHRLRFQWAKYPTAANPGGDGHFERLVGRRDIRRVYDRAPDSIDADLVREWTSTGDWAQRVEPVLLYV
ncbi:MAG: DUF1343 domain-containing protein [Gemmatimonadota bacterium]|nr:DUF1343 domain-containing protein [Gemmatimonadota bacterium]